MFWLNKSKNKKHTDKQKGSQESRVIEGDRVDDLTASQRLREEALANARKAREHIGEDTLDRIAAAMKKKQESKIERLKSELQSKDGDHLAAEIMALMDEE